jgi:hypothetical protein
VFVFDDDVGTLGMKAIEKADLSGICHCWTSFEWC